MSNRAILGKTEDVWWLKIHSGRAAGEQSYLGGAEKGGGSQAWKKEGRYIRGEQKRRRGIWVGQKGGRCIWVKQNQSTVMSYSKTYQVCKHNIAIIVTLNQCRWLKSILTPPTSPSIVLHSQ